MNPPSQAPLRQTDPTIPKEVNFKELLPRAREFFYKLDPNVIGINIVPSRAKSPPEPFEQVLVVYVLEKKARSVLDPTKVIPKEFLGLRTEVRAPLSLGAPRPVGDFDQDVALRNDRRAIDWRRVHELTVTAPASPATPNTPNVQDFGDICVVEDDGQLLFFPTSMHPEVNYFHAYQLFRTLHGDDFDFVTFFVDEASGMPNPGNSEYHSLFNDVQGIGREPRDDRHGWGTSRLEGYHIIKPNPLTWRGTMLQEFGHRFLASARYQDPETHQTMSDHLREGEVPFGHWAKELHISRNVLDDDKSPMDYGSNDWNELPSGAFSSEFLSPDDRFYCNLDLYLMGLLGPGEVGQITVLRNVTSIAGSPHFAATPVRLTVQEFIKEEGDRVPNVKVSPKHWRQAFVILTKSMRQVQGLVKTVDGLRLQWEQIFREATKGLGSVDTALATGPADFTVIFKRLQFGDERNSIERFVPFAGAQKDFTFSCPKVNANEPAVLMFQSRAVTSSKNIITINGRGVGGIPVNPSPDAWNGNVLLINPRILRPTGNVLHIEARNESGGNGGNIDDFILDSVVVMYKRR